MRIIPNPHTSVNSFVPEKFMSKGKGHTPFLEESMEEDLLLSDSLSEIVQPWPVADIEPNVKKSSMKTKDSSLSDLSGSLMKTKG